MAFKTAQESEELRETLTRYTHDDANYRAKTMRSVEVELTPRLAEAGLTSMSFHANTYRDNQRGNITVSFNGPREDDFIYGRIYAEMMAELGHSANADMNISRKVTIKGYWKKCNLMSFDGTEVVSWQLRAAEWHYTPEGADAVITEGKLPFTR